jgi:hypothetical protein
MDIEKLFFAFIVEDFNGIKKIYKRDPKKAFKLFQEKLKKVDKKLKDTNAKTTSFKIQKGL